MKVKKIIVLSVILGCFSIISHASSSSASEVIPHNLRGCCITCSKLASECFEKALKLRYTSNEQNLLANKCFNDCSVWQSRNCNRQTYIECNPGQRKAT